MDILQYPFRWVTDFCPCRLGHYLGPLDRDRVRFDQRRSGKLPGRTHHPSPVQKVGLHIITSMPLSTFLFHSRPIIKHYVTLLLEELGFSACFVVQDHCVATFGSGAGSACVVDIGDQKTSISCVEDFLSYPETRLHLNYGSADIAQVWKIV